MEKNTFNSQDGHEEEEEIKPFRPAQEESKPQEEQKEEVKEEKPQDEKEEKYSHSQMMLKKPEYIRKDAEEILNSIEDELGIKIQEKVRKNILHIVLSHHGKWGRIEM